jgi:hypothetical protein
VGRVAVAVDDATEESHCVPLLGPRPPGARRRDAEVDVM